MEAGAVKISELNFKYPDYNNFQGSQIFIGLNLKLEPGSINTVFGAAESGKTTLAHILSALVPAHTGGDISGSVFIDDLDVLNVKAAEIIEKCGIIFQDPERQTVTTECFTEAAFALESLGVNESEIEKRVFNAFSELGISSLLDAGTAETSGGEKKKIALAGLIAVNPDIWILDETFEELDNPSRIKLFSILKKSKKTIIILSSKYYDAFKKSDAFYLLEDGKVSDKFKMPFSGEYAGRFKSAGIIPDFRSGSGKKDKDIKKKSASAEPEKVIALKDIKYSYPAGRFSLSVDSFELYEGEVLAIVGRNGCGKSTLAGILCGLLEADDGEINVRDNSANEFVPDSVFLNSFVAFMFQNPDYQIFLPTVREELSFGLIEAGYSSKVVKAMAEKAAAEFKLPGLEAPPALLSFSIRKRLQAAVYHLLRRPVFILDEADTGLSYPDFISLLSRLKESSKALIIITHNLELASASADRVVGMSRGRVYSDILDYSPDKLNEWLSESGDKFDC